MIHRFTIGLRNEHAENSTDVIQEIQREYFGYIKKEFCVVCNKRMHTRTKSNFGKRDNLAREITSRKYQIKSFN